MQVPSTIRTLAFAMILTLLGSALAPGLAAAASSGEATATAAEVTVTTSGATTTTTVAETVAATNSEGGIVADTPATPENEALDTTVVVTTPIRVEDEQVRANPESTQASAPGTATNVTTCDPCEATDSAGTTSSMTGGSGQLADEDAGFASITFDEAALSTGTATTTLGKGVSSAYILHGIPGGPESDLISGFATAGTGDIFVPGDPIVSTSTYLDGHVTLGQASVELSVSADGSTSTATRTFRLTDLRLLDAPGGNTLIYVSEGTGVGTDALTLVLTITIGDGTAEITVSAGVDLLAATTYAGTSLEDDYALIQPQLAALTAPGAALEGLSITLGEGLVDSGDGTYARAEMTAVRIEASPNGASDVTATVGHAYVGVDAVRGFSTVTNPELPAGATPISNPEVAFPATHGAVPVEQVVSVRECSPEDTDLFSDELDEDCRDSVVVNVESGGGAATDVTASGELPNTGFDLGALLLAALLAMGIGGALHLSARQGRRGATTA